MKRDARPGAGLGIAVLLLCGVAASSACRFTGNHPACRAHADARSCADDRRCLPRFRCQPGAKAGRCSRDCSPYVNTTCWVDVRNRPDACIVDFRGGRFRGCIATDRDPARCEPGPAQANGLPGCVDRNPPCSGCDFVFDFCDAYGVCSGIICY